MNLSPRLRKLALTVHVASAVGWLGAAATTLALALAGMTGADVLTVRSAYVSLELIGWYVLVPLGFATMLTGLVVSLGSRWGLFRHYWVAAKFLIAALSIVVLLAYTQTLGEMAAAAREVVGEDAGALRNPSPVLHAGLAVVALLIATTLSVYKPWGMTRFGRRKQHRERASAAERPRG
jgi:hypothetical protein